MISEKNLIALGLAITTTELGAGGVTKKGEEAFAAVPMEGRREWHSQRACDLNYLPKMVRKILGSLIDQGFKLVLLQCLSVAVRQHDMVVVLKDGSVLPALTWQCTVATEQVKQLRDAGVEKVVGRVEERFILPKLMWLLTIMPEIRDQIQWIMTTGDYFTWKLTGGLPRLSTSDGLSNGLLNQETKEFAVDVIKKAGLEPKWFPEPIQSGELVGKVDAPDGSDEDWDWIRKELQGCACYAGLGDNAGQGQGAGLHDEQTMGVCCGTSGPIWRIVSPGVQTVGNAASFEYDSLRRLLLMMLADCGEWYNRFVNQWGNGQELSDLDALASAASLDNMRRVTQRAIESGFEEIYPKDWDQMTLGEKAASIQLSIAYELALLVKAMLSEVTDNGALSLRRVILVGGMSRSGFFQAAFYTCLESLEIDLEVLITDRKGAMAFKLDAAGAMHNAMIGHDLVSGMEEIAERYCPIQPCARPLKLAKLDTFFES